MLRRFIRWLFIWVFKVDIAKLIKECVYIQMKELVDTGKLKPENVPVDVKLKCTIRKYEGVDGDVLECHSICDGALLTPQQAREKKGWTKIKNTTESVHLV